MLKLINEQAVSAICLLGSRTLFDGLKLIDETGLEVILCVDDEEKFLGLMTSGDIRRALTEPSNLHTKLSLLINRECFKFEDKQVINQSELTQAVNNFKFVPCLRKDKTLEGLYYLSSNEVNTIVIMAGGFGTRLGKLTQNLPKPMIEVGGKPILHHIIDKAVNEGFTDIIIIVHYLAEKIVDYFKDGREFGANIRYVEEKKPLGTAGGLSLIETVDTKCFIMVNADVLTEASFRDIVNFHLNNNATATMVVKEHTIQNPFGVVKTSGLQIIGFEEKPFISSLVNAGIYVFSQQILELCPRDQVLDAPDLFEIISQNKYKTIVCPIDNDWIDVGRIEDLEKVLTKK